jgi:hypothetical protein
MYTAGTDLGFAVHFFVQDAEKLVVREALFLQFLCVVVSRGSTWNHHYVLAVLKSVTREGD